MSLPQPVNVRGEVAELADARKCQKYADIPSGYTFLPIAM